MKAKKPCSKPGCPEVTDTGRCSSCRYEADNARGTARERGYDASWEKVRRAYLYENPFCSINNCLVPAKDVDHKDGLGPKGPRGYDWDNLRGFCHAHHSQRTARDQGGFRSLGY